VSGLTVVDCPAVDCVAKGPLEVSDVGATDSDFNELALIDKNFEIVPTSCTENLSSKCCFKPIAVSGFTNERLVVEEGEFG
jgi:hypothetical protein